MGGCFIPSLNFHSVPNEVIGKEHHRMPMEWLFFWVKWHFEVDRSQRNEDDCAPCKKKMEEEKAQHVLPVTHFMHKTQSAIVFSNITWLKLKDYKVITILDE